MDPRTRLRITNFAWLAVFAGFAFGGLWLAFLIVRSFMTVVLEIR